MPLQNRVTPQGEIVAVAARGTFLGNRGGCFHTARQTLTASRWKSRAWITCLLVFKNRRRALMQPNRYTELFFLDEVTALAAGHRPCFECRRADAKAFFEAWDRSGLAPQGRRADDMDRVLHGQRLAERRAKRTWQARLGELPSGTMVLMGDTPHALAGSRLLAWSHDGYMRASPYDENTILTVLTPPTSVEILRAGYRPHIHASADALAGDHCLKNA